jgi:hypothetical protein
MSVTHIVVISNGIPMDSSGISGIKYQVKKKVSFLMNYPEIDPGILLA